MIEDEEEKIRRKIRDELKPFLDGVLNGEADLRELDYVIFKLRYHAQQDLFSRVMGYPEDLLSDTKGVARELFFYLGFVESLGNAIVDIVVMLVVANGKDFHIECGQRMPRVKHADSISDLIRERVPLATKLNFLRDNGIVEIPSIIDSKLRNDIAHLNLKIDDEDVYIRGKPAKQAILLGLRKLNALGVVYDGLERVARAKWPKETSGSN